MTGVDASRRAAAAARLPAVAADSAGSSGSAGRPGSAGSVWSPLRAKVFRAIWIAGLASNVGSWMHLVAAQWEMTSLSKSAALVGLLSTASSLPAFALALPAGALADVVDRRRLILFAQAWQFVVAALLGVLTVAEVTTPAILLGATLLLGFGASLGVPAFLGDHYRTRRPGPPAGRYLPELGIDHTVSGRRPRDRRPAGRLAGQRRRFPAQRRLVPRDHRSAGDVATHAADLDSAA